MRTRSYYSTRTGKNPAARLDLAMLKRLFRALFTDLCNREYLQEMLGKDCPDDRDAFGTVGPDVEAYVLRRVRKAKLWPIADRLDSYSEDDLFDMIEFLYDHVSEGAEGFMHSYNGCGMHFNTFDREPAQASYRNDVNELLADYGSGYALSTSGEIEHLPEAGFANLVIAGLPSADQQNVDDRVKAAVKKYLLRAATLDDRREAVRGLADVLEYLRPGLKNVLNTKDEADLFNIANNFAIRHHNEKQRGDYDPNIWISWMFYFYLATIHAAQRMILRAARKPTAPQGRSPSANAKMS